MAEQVLTGKRWICNVGRGSGCMYLSVENIIVLFCAGLTFLMVLSQIISSRREAGNALFILVLLCILALQVQHVAAGTAVAGRFRYLFSIHGAIWYLLGPLTYLHYRNVIFRGRSSYRRALVLLVPFAAVTAIEAIPSVRGVPDPGVRHVLLDPAYRWNVHYAVKTGGLTALLAFFGEFFVFVFRTWSLRGMPLIVRYVVASYIVPTASIALILAAYLAGEAVLERVGFMIFAVQMAGWHLIGYRLPEVFLLFRREMKKKYARSLIGRIDADFAIERLRSLMDGERLYTDETLTVAALAQRLGLTAHQLSELLNARLGMSFKNYVNAKRVDEAKRLLVENGEATVLSVGLAMGFNSKSAFYSVFKAHTGATPQEYRKRERAGKK